MSKATHPKFSAILLLAAILFTATSAGAFSLDGLFGRREVDQGIPEYQRRSFKTSRNDIVMVFEGTRWHSLSERAVSGAPAQQQSLCVALTRSDREQDLIPAGFSYTTDGSGRLYLVRTGPTPPPVISDGPRFVSARVEPRPVVTAAAALAPEPVPAPVRRVDASGGAKSYRTAVGDVLMKPRDGCWVGYAPPKIRRGLTAPQFCAMASARDRLKGTLSHNYAYVLLADDRLVAVPRENRLARMADAQ